MGSNKQKVSVANFKPQSYTQKNVTFSDTPLYFSDQYPYLFLLFYFLILPYIAGVVFLLIFVAKFDFEVFLSLDMMNSYLMVWAIGYEMIATMVLLVIFKNAIAFSFKNRKNRTHYTKLSKLDQKKRKYKEYL